MNDELERQRRINGTQQTIIRNLRNELKAYQEMLEPLIILTPEGERRLTLIDKAIIPRDDYMLMSAKASAFDRMRTIMRGIHNRQEAINDE